MADLWNWWFGWGAIVFLVATLFIAALVLFESFQRRQSVAAWQLGVIAPLLLILPSFFYKLSLPAGYQYQFELPRPVAGFTNTNYDSTGDFFLWLGVVAGILSVIVAIGYFMIVASRPVAPRRDDRGVGGMQDGGMGYMGPMGGPIGGPMRNNAGETRNEGGNGGGRASGGRPRGTPANGMLYLRSGPGGGRQFQLRTGRNTVGREIGNDIVIDDPDISRDHAHVQEQSGHFAIFDHGSTHGTYVNNQRVRGQVYLQDNDEILLGPSVALLFKCY